MRTDNETSIPQPRIRQRATGETIALLSPSQSPLKRAVASERPSAPSHERRRTPRYQALNGSLFAFLSHSQEENEGDGVLLDLSKGGCRITSEVPLAVSQYYRLILHAIVGQPVTIETAVVCWHSKSVYGLKFITVEEDQEELLEEIEFHPNSAWDDALEPGAGSGVEVSVGGRLVLRPARVTRFRMNASLDRRVVAEATGTAMLLAASTRPSSNTWLPARGRSQNRTCSSREQPERGKVSSVRHSPRTRADTACARSFFACRGSSNITRRPTMRHPPERTARMA